MGSAAPVFINYGINALKKNNLFVNAIRIDLF